MATRNFNLTFPICDALFGTSELKKGLWGTLFHGAGHATMGEEERRVLGIDSAEVPARQRSPQHHDS